MLTVIGSIYERKPIVVRRRLGNSLWYSSLLDARLVKIDIEIGSKYLNNVQIEY